MSCGLNGIHRAERKNNSAGAEHTFFLEYGLLRASPDVIDGGRAER